ncbi:MAG: uroporphyrinogen-III decarboxylase [Gammaproteobacteria bacterium]|nr:uroporphyrinogen-III decarboxylase [Gammaproteobacteria bacterium]
MSGPYPQRLDLIRRTIAMETVERVPSIYMGTAFAPRYMGGKIARFCNDMEYAFQVQLDAMDRLGYIDGANIATGGRIGPILSALWLSRVAVPGIELPEDTLWQVMEAEVMTVADYDVILEKGWKPFVHDYLPRVVDMGLLGETFAWMGQNGARMQRSYVERGYVVLTDAKMAPTPPFEALCGARSMQKFFLDLLRIPNKVEAVMQVIMKDVMAEVEAMPPWTGPGVGGTWVGGWRGAPGLLAPRHFDRFVWPYIVEIVRALVGKGYTPILHFDQDWNRELGRLNELPQGKCILNPDGMTSMRKFKDVAGDSMAMLGDVPSVLLSTGTTEAVADYTRNLLALFGNRGLLFCGGCDMPINARPENVETMLQVLREHNERLH